MKKTVVMKRAIAVKPMNNSLMKPSSFDILRNASRLFV